MSMKNVPLKSSRTELASFLLASAASQATVSNSIAVLCVTYLRWFRPVFLNRLAADRYRALGSIITGSERSYWNL